MNERPHLSIGEVLSLLQDEFPDITISKIRFLESQGLLDPERTPSGYRKFYEHDLARLRWILTQQRDHFLPLRVIKDRLDAGFVPGEVRAGVGSPVSADAAAPSRGLHTATPGHAATSGHSATPGAPATGSDADGDAEGAGVVGAAQDTTAEAAPAGPARRSRTRPAARAGNVVGGGPGGATDRNGTGLTEAVSGSGAAVTGGRGDDGGTAGGRSAVTGPTEGRRPAGSGGAQDPASTVGSSSGAEPAGGPGPNRAGGPPGAAARSEGTDGPPSTDPARRRPADLTALSMSLTELAAACGQTVADLHELERFGLIAGEHVGSSVVYREDALLVARLAARFGRHGIEPRHLRQYRVAAEREVALVEQVIAPFLGPRGRVGQAGEAAITGRRSALEAAEELTGLGEELRQVLVERGLRSYLDGI